MKSLLFYFPSTSLPNITLILSQLTLWTAKHGACENTSDNNQETVNLVKEVEARKLEVENEIRSGCLIRDKETPDEDEAFEEGEISENENDKEFRSESSIPAWSEILRRFKDCGKTSCSNHIEAQIII